MIPPLTDPIKDYQKKISDETNISEQVLPYKDEEIYKSRIQVGQDFMKDFKPDLWLIKDILPSSEVAELFGASGSRKTFLALDMGVCIHNGIQWHGHDVIKGNVLYVCAEGTNGVRKRLSAYCRHYNVQDPLHVLPTSIDMMKEDSVQQLAKDIELIGNDYVYIIIDTLNANFTGSENDADDFAVMKKNLLKHIGGDSRLIQWVHHTGNAEGERGRGSSARYAGVDSVIQTKKNEQYTVLSCKKIKDSEAFEDLNFSFKSVETGFCEDDGTPLFSLVPVLDGEAPKKVLAKPPAKNDEICKGIRLALKDGKGVKPSDKFRAMFDLTIEDNYVLDIKTAKSYAYKMFDDANKTAAFSRWLKAAQKASICYFYDDFIILANDAKTSTPSKTVN